MNWLAHLVLSEPGPAFRVGNVLADLLPITEVRRLGEPFQAGVARHRAIDAYTDRHPLFRQSIARLDPRYRRYGAVIMDIFYDHLLTATWSNYCAEPVDRFIARFHADVELCRDEIPAGAYSIFERMRIGAWLASYGEMDGVRKTLERMSRRLRRPFDLESAAEELRSHYDGFTEDFAVFFPEIQGHFSSNPGSLRREM